jgi:Flp pilus assembly protein TadD
MGTGTPGSGAPSSTPAQQAPTAIPGQIPQNQMPIFLSGRVLMDDGTAPATSIPIQRICSGSPRTVAFTDNKGQFNFQWGTPTGMVPEASEIASGNGMRMGDDTGTGGLRGQMSGSSIPGSSMLGCELVANAPGFRSGRLDLSNHRATDNPELGAIVLHRLAGVEGTSVSATALNAPKDARKAWERGSRLLHEAQNGASSRVRADRNSKLAEAAKELEKAVEIYPKYANAWLDLGRARNRQQAAGPAREAFLKAIDADGKLVEPYLELGEGAARRQDWPDAARFLDRALQLDPVDYPSLWFEDAVADYNVQNFDRAEKNAREALKVPLVSRDPHANQLLGLILMNKRDYTGAGEALRAYVRLVPNARDLDQVRAQLNEIESHREHAATPVPH